MPKRRRFARKRRTKRRMKKGAGAKLMSQKANNGTSRVFKFTDTFPLQTAPTVGGGNNPAAMYNFCCLNNGAGVGPTSYYRVIAPNNCQLNNQNRIRTLY